MVDIGIMIVDILFRLFPYVPWIIVLILLYLIFLNSQLIYSKLIKDIPKEKKIAYVNTTTRHSILVIVPTYNESKTIRQKIENLYSLHYPADKFAIAIVDGSSTDTTAQISLEIQNEKQNIKPKLFVVQQESRTGKSNGILYCLNQIKYGDLILVTDANCRLDSEALIRAEKEFRNPNVGGVTLRISIPESPKNWVSESERYYWNLMNRQRIQISRKGLFFHFNGAFQMMRRELTNRIFETSNYTYAEDMIGGIVTVLSGYKVVYLHDTSVVERGITSVVDLIRQKKNRAIGLYDTIKVFRNIVSPVKKQYQTLVYLKTVIPLLSPLIFVSIITFFAITIPLDLLIIFLIGASILAVGISKIRYFIIIQIAITRALLSIFMRRREQFWEKTESDRIWPDEPELVK